MGWKWTQSREMVKRGPQDFASNQHEKRGERVFKALDSREKGFYPSYAQTLDIPDDAKQRLLDLTPAIYPRLAKTET